MSFARRKEVIEEGDTVILYINIHSIHALQVKPWLINKHSQKIPNIFQTIYGALNIPSLVGKKYGTKVQLKQGWIYVLHPTPELWTMALPHRTQILYSTDISMVISQLELRPGSKVCEAGTGSGSLSHSILRTIAPEGFLYTYDFHEKRVATAEEEFHSHGWKDHVKACHRDVCQDGFGLSNEVDAVFLDLPHPWEVVASAKEALKQVGGRICSFSPCIEQVQRTCDKLREEGFLSVSTMECLLRQLQVRSIHLPVLDLSEDSTISKCPVESEPATKKKRSGKCQKKRQKIEKLESFHTALPLYNIAGHTGFLTFATLPPKL